MVQYRVNRVVEPTIFGYGMTINEAIYNLVHNVRPFFNDDLVD